MSIISIQNLCNYLEDLGIIDKKSLNPFLSLYTKEINKNINNIDFDDTNSKTESIILILENSLCSYLKKIFNIERNYKIFSHKIIEKFKENYLIKQYNCLFLLFFIFSKKLKYSIFNSFYSIKNYNNEEKSFLNNNMNGNFDKNKKSEIFFKKFINNRKYNNENNIINNSNHFDKKNFFKYFNENNNNNNFNNKENDNFNEYENTNKINNNYEYEYEYDESIKNNKYNKKKLVNHRNKTSFNIYTKKAKSLNNSVNGIKRIMIQQKSIQIKNNKDINKTNKNSNYNNIQFENKKNQFLSRIKRDHSINFKKKENFINSHISKIYTIKNKENRNINYIKYNKNDSEKSNENSFFKNNNFFRNDQTDFSNYKKMNVLTSCYNQNNYDNKYDIYHLNKSKTSLNNIYSNNSLNYIKKENNEENSYFNTNGEISSINSKNNSKNANLVFNQNYVGIKNLKYNCFSNDNIKYYNKIEHKMDIDVLTSDESSI